MSSENFFRRAAHAVTGNELKFDERNTLSDDEAAGLVERPGKAYPTDCTCEVRRPGFTLWYGKKVRVCWQCGSLRVGTGT